jgi:hypothetical protein
MPGDTRPPSHQETSSGETEDRVLNGRNICLVRQPWPPRRHLADLCDLAAGARAAGIGNAHQPEILKRKY